MCECLVSRVVSPDLEVASSKWDERGQHSEHVQLDKGENIIIGRGVAIGR